MYRFLLFVTTSFLVIGCGAQPASNSADIAPAPDAPRISPAAYQQSIASTDHILLDVRTEQEVAGGVIPGAQHIALNELSSRVSELPADQTIVIYCNSGNRSRSAVDILARAGHDNLLDLGGVVQWQQAGFDLTPLQS